MAHNLEITPTQGHFNTQEIRNYLDGQPDALEAPTRVNTYLFVGHPNSVAGTIARCIQNPSELPYALLVLFNEDYIVLSQEYSGSDELVSGLNFLRWLSQRREFNVRIEGFHDLTDQIRSGGVESLYDERVRSMRPSWDGELLQIGFFDDFFDSRGGVPSSDLKSCISESPQEDEDKVLIYLRSGHFYRAFAVPDDELHDALDTDKILPIEPALFTDGTYVWPSDLPYYVEQYHAHLPPAFLHHARQNGWQVPASVDVGSLKMVDV